MSENLLNQILDKLNTVIHEQQEMKQEVSEIKGDVGILKGDVGNLKETVATKKDVEEFPTVKSVIYDIGDTVDRIEAAQEKHERTLDLLARRSIDQEAEIKRIK
jgi:hypothetical protein